MPISKVGQRRQVVIPKEICEDLGIEEGDFVEVTRVKEAVMIKPKRLVDPKDPLAPLKAIQTEAKRKGVDKLSMREIDELIAQVRKEQREKKGRKK